MVSYPTHLEDGLFLEPETSPGILTLSAHVARQRDARPNRNQRRRNYSMSPSLSPWPSTITLMYGFRNLTLALR